MMQIRLTYTLIKIDNYLRTDEVKTDLQSLKTGKASGPDLINTRILEHLLLSYPLANLFNQSLSSGHVPLLWKRANEGVTARMYLNPFLAKMELGLLL